jgi:hypothetical protein
MIVERRMAHINLNGVPHLSMREQQLLADRNHRMTNGTKRLVPHNVLGERRISQRPSQPNG